MKIEVLMSTCNRQNIKELDLEEKNVDTAVIVNQFAPSYKKNKCKNIVMYSYNEKGIAKSRNRLIENMTGDIEIITDDDIKFVDNYKDIIKEAYDNNDADIIVFNMKKGDEVIGYNKKFYYNRISIMSICSCQVTFKSKSIKDKYLKFDEQFGIGSKYISGEENIFLKDALDKNLKILHVPIVINEHPAEETTGERWNEKVIISKGAFSYRSYRKIYIILLLYFSIMKYNKYKNDFSFFKFIKLFNKGKKEYIKYSKR